ncbi:amidohydrolase family protein [Mycobacterium arosiense]|uniref:Amidohydrolase-related domain-containing protein n=1 Tax=Mycobacterium arosiense ATCC BAA-1401 = DSM 45069 TaxID=1265311 RepID=A0A1W9Z7F1_MYCAI|nr:amidohydrolase family protein [Mycobacterium arosiense]ORA08345.1 hypothetical protein BST14_24335 [Mycobacterium arosiense ATCC BAA-1401 = DSM 45069]
MDIVDAQLHLGRGMVTPMLEAMDALGITSVLVDELWGGGLGEAHPTHIEPGYRLGNGAWRAAWPTAEEASIVHPDRFSYVVRIDRRDPQLESVMRFVGSTPHARAFRLQPVWTLDEVEAFANGAYWHLLEIAREVALPLFLFIPGYVELLEPYARRYPDLTFVIDHCGMEFPGIPLDRPQPKMRAAQDVGYFDQVLRMAELPNVALKWSHAQDCFGVATFPYDALRPLLRRAIEAFGADRLLWASDKSVMAGHTWSDLLDCIRNDRELSRDEREWILGGSARRILKWPLTTD